MSPRRSPTKIPRTSFKSLVGFTRFQTPEVPGSAAPPNEAKSPEASCWAESIDLAHQLAPLGGGWGSPHKRRGGSSAIGIDRMNDGYRHAQCLSTTTTLKPHNRDAARHQSGWSRAQRGPKAGNDPKSFGK